MVSKKTGDWLPCGDAAATTVAVVAGDDALNPAAVPNQNLITDMQGCAARLRGSIILSKLELVKAYHQISV